MTRTMRTDWPRYVWIALLIAAAWVSLLGLRGWWQGTTATSRVEAVAQRLEQAVAAPTDSPAESPPDKKDKPDKTSVKKDPGALAVQRIRDRHLFMPKPPERFRSIQGVLGNRVLYAGGQSFAVGENAMGATVKAVNSEWVEFEFQGETVRIEMFPGRGGGGGGDRRKGRKHGR